MASIATTCIRGIFFARGLSLSAILSLSCGASLRDAPRGPHPLVGAVNPIEIDETSPPTKVEVLPPAPSPSCSWADGYWHRQGHSWLWRPGRWLRPEGCYRADAFAVWITRADGTSSLFYTPTAWYEESTGRLCPEPIECRAPVAF